jgi:hypothetical protein
MYEDAPQTITTLKRGLLFSNVESAILSEHLAFMSAADTAQEVLNKRPAYH